MSVFLVFVYEFLLFLLCLIYLPVPRIVLAHCKINFKVSGI